MVIIVVSYIALGCVAGVIAGLLGLGGGIVIVPILNYSLPYFGVTEDVQRLALGTSMASIIFTSLSSVRAHAGHGAVLWGVVKRLTPGIIAGTALGGTLAAHVPVQVLTGIFVVFLFYVGTQIFLNIKPKPTRCLPGTAGMIGVGGGIGLMSSFVGIGGVPIPNYVWYAVIIVILMWFVWNKTTFGKNMFAVGSNPEAANVSGVNVMRTTILVHTLAGAMYGITGFIESARIGSNSAGTGLNYECDAIAACVIGGVSFVGGTGKISGVVLGIFILRIIFGALIFLSIDQNWQFVIKGLIILVACAIDMRKYLVRK